MHVANGGTKMLCPLSLFTAVVGGTAEPETVVYG